MFFDHIDYDVLFFKGFIKDVDLETSHLTEINDLLSILTERKCDQQIIQTLEKKRRDTLHDIIT